MENEQSSRYRLNDNMKPVLSILLPAHQASKTIGLAVLSTLAFKPKSSELLIFLDGAGTKSKVLSWVSARQDVKVFSSEKKIGISGALNALILNSEGGVVARMDADDISLPGRFLKGMQLVNAGSEDFVFTNIILFGSRVKPFGFLPHLPIGVDNEQARWLLWLGNPFAHPTMIARKSAIESLGGYRNSISEDYDLWVRAAAAGFKLRRLRRHGLLYRIHPGQHTQQKNFGPLVKSDPLLREARRALELELNDGRSDSDEEELNLKASTYLMRSRIGLATQMKFSNWRRKNLRPEKAGERN